ncbi:MAG: TetR/AcrR family transcriptional regulator [Gemmatimonadota bacterium]|jgi:TetR/AcrR family transcriptional repressor of nem operon
MIETDTRSRLIEAGCELMLARGYSATSIDDLCKTVGVSKGSFYHFFRGKEEFGLAVLEDYYERGVATVESGDFATIPDPLERLRGFFDHLEAIAPDLWRHGCLMGAFAAELWESSPMIHARVGELFDSMAARMAPLFVSAVGDEDEGSALAVEMLAMLEGWIVLARAHDDPQRIADGVRRFRNNISARIVGLEPEPAR